MPVIDGDGIHDDTVRIQALLNTRDRLIELPMPKELERRSSIADGCLNVPGKDEKEGYCLITSFLQAQPKRSREKPSRCCIIAGNGPFVA